MKKIKCVKIISCICFAFMLFGLSFVLAFTSTTTAGETSLSNSPTFSIYFVSTAKSQLENEALTLAKDTMNCGDGGYVWKKDNYYYVISSGYENKNDAILVSKQLEKNNIQNEVFEINFPSVSLTSPIESSEAKSTFTAGVNLFYTTFKSLFDISVSLDTKIYDETKAFIEINKSLSRADEVMKNFHLLFGEINNPICKNLEEAIIDENETLGMLSENQKITEKQTLVSQIRYCYTKICAIYHNFLEKID